MSKDLDAEDRHLARCFARGIAGDPSAYREFLTLLANLLRRYFRKRLHERAGEIDDLVQEAVLAVHNRRHTYSGSVPITAWIHAIARHKFVDLLRSEAGRASLFEPIDASDAGDVSTHDGLAVWQAERELRQLLATLPAKQRLAIEAVKLQGLSVAEAARSTGMSESAIKVYIHRGMRALAARRTTDDDGFASA